ncbi:MAG: 2Fe-2S iron-sulfur cluster binding domain-containing protein [Gammaproteobacteria bacterium]|nr:2Fe-2S iron-sulfur cluster binding domain-containing protein [Gammaproteobacteria bacterium]
MPKLLSLSRAARLAGVSRGELQKRIREEDLQTFEGELTVDLLLRLYPHIDLEADPMLEKVRRIRAEAKPKTHFSDGWMPDPEVLMTRLKEFQHVLVQTKAALNNSDALLQQTLDDLNAAAQAPEEQLREQLLRCSANLERAMQRVERAEDARAALFARDVMLKIVSASIRLLPSGHEFFLEGSDSILEAGLKAGLYIDYGCSSGNCGACKCKVISGAVSKLRSHDFILSAKEQEEGYILACSNTAISDLVIEAREANAKEPLPHQNIRATVRKIEPVGDDLALLFVQTPRTQSLRFKAGQSVALTTENGNRAELYIASCPCDGRNLQFLVERAPGKGFNDTVFAKTMNKQTLTIDGPMGGFVLREDSSTPAIFLAKGTGFAPIKSLVEQAITIDNAERLQLIQVGGNPPGSYLDNLCRSWSDSLDNFAYASPDQDCSAGHLVEMIQQAADNMNRFDLYIAGPQAWLSSVTVKALARGFNTTYWYCQPTD